MAEAPREPTVGEDTADVTPPRYTPLPVILLATLDDDSLTVLDGELRRRYAADYEVVTCADYGHARAVLEGLRRWERDVAMVLAFYGPRDRDGLEFLRRAPDGSTITAESVMRNVLPLNVMAMAMGMHVRCGNEDTLYGPDGGKITSVQQVEQLVRVAKELGREVATAKEAREIYKIGVQYNSVDETLAQLGMVPNREPGRRALPNRYAA